ncbi:hypothetical protein ACONUD_02365 [Microbulbifer harenosus]|uniref:Uncharacterized protein n=2 Tax=Microbulbifer harenosus TaxID=2576840 RepID=A0ABY2UG98_9GAMM|nr:hypothetical protein FDY93_19340 [Microbulbifer harenosus]
MEMKAPLEHAEFHELCNRFGRAILVVVGKVESHEIINFKLFRAFRFGLQSIHHDLLKLRTEADRFKVLEEVVELANNTLMYFYDFQICMQNISYGDVFDSEVPSREPADPSCKVIINCPNHLDELIVYFSQETNWGMDCAKYEKEALEAYS